jgi:hypothetical protein
MELQNLSVGKEAQDFVKACEAIHAQLLCGPLPTDDQDVIIIMASKLLTELNAPNVSLLPKNEGGE